MTDRPVELSNSQAASNDVCTNLFAEAYNLSPRPSRAETDRTSKGSDHSESLLAHQSKQESGPQARPDEASAGIAAQDDGVYDEFMYAEIYRDVPPEVRTASAGDTVDNIARQHLGPDADEQQVRAHSDEIRAHNGILPGENPSPGQQMLLPGHNEEGDVRLLQADKTDPNYATSPRYTEYTLSGDPAVRYQQEMEDRGRSYKPPVPAESSGTDTACYPVSWDVDVPIRDGSGERTGDWEHWRYRARRCPTPDGRHTDSDVTDQHIPLPRPNRPHRRHR